MRTQVKIEHFLNKYDYQLIRAALKQKNVTVKSVIKELNITKDEFYDQVHGKKPVCEGLLEVIDSLNICLTFEVK